MENGVFQEVQTFRQPVLWAFMLALILAVLGPQLYRIATDPGPVGGGRWLALAISAVVLTAVTALLWMCRLETRVDGVGVHTRFFPLERQMRRLDWAEVTGWDAVEVKPIRDHGGWGLRYGMKGKAYLVNGNQAIRFDLKSGKSLFVGTTRPDDFRAAIERSRS